MDDDDDISSTASFRYRWDVFSSFRGEETRHNFTESLYIELLRNGIRTFRDDEELERGEEIPPSLVEGIQDSAAAIAVISNKYASSRWCLEELARIFEYRKLVLLVFYKVDPSDVRRQKGPFEEDFVRLEERFGEDKVERWRRAMEKAGGISGWDYSNCYSSEGLTCAVMQASEPVDVVILPGLAFDKCGGRLGRSGGYYDVFIKKYQELAEERKWKQPLRVALSYSVQIIEEGSIPVTPNDVPVDALVSPSGFIPISPAALERCD